jgi:hypothetical protein
MIRFLIFRFPRRRAVSTMIGGIIVLSLLLVGLGAMVFVSQQNDQYQQSVEGMMQRNNQQSSESLVFNFPGLTLPTSSAVAGWGSGCTTTYNCYNMTVSDLGGVGVQVVRIYINSTGSGCTSLCVLNPTSTITNYGFNQANSFLNAGEVNHWLILALPIGITLPNPYPPIPRSTILVVTSRGNVFSFQWPFRIPFYKASSSAFSSGVLKIAYQTVTSGYDSKNEAGPVAGITIPAYVPGSGSGGKVTSGYCHTEPEQAFPADSNHAEKLTVTGVTGNTLYFVDPWITEPILSSAARANTQLYMYAVATNTFNYTYRVESGTTDLTWYTTNHIDGVLIGLYYPVAPGAAGQFYPTGSLPPIPPGTTYYAIFKLNQIQLQFPPPYPDSGLTSSYMFWGTASLSTSALDQTYFAGTLLSSGLWIRYVSSGSYC